jgi:hypothetical protein
MAYAQSLDTVLDLYRFNEANPNSDHMREAHALAQDIINSKSESEIASMPGGREFLGRYKKLEIYYDLKRRFHSCVESRRNLKERLLDSAWTADPCDIFEAFENQNLDTLVRDINQVQLNNPNSLYNAKEALYHQAVLSSARSLWEYQRLMNEHPSDEDRIKDICKEIDNCSNPKLKRELEKELAEFHMRFDGQTTPSLDQQLNEINQGIGEINATLAQIDVEVDEGWVHLPGINSDDPEFNEVTQMQHMLYHEQYFKLASSGLGTMLMTEHMQDKVGTPRAMDEVEEDRRNGQTDYTYRPHKNINKRDLRRAFREVKSDISNQLKDLHKTYDVGVIDRLTLIDDQDRIDELVQVYPASAGLAMMKNPEIFPHICEAIDNIEKSDRNGETLKKVALYGGVTIGTLAALTGVGAVFAAGIYSSAAAAGSASAVALASTASTVATVSFGVGVGVGVAETGYFASQSYGAYQNYQSARQSIISGTTDREGYYEAQAELESFHDNFNEAIRTGFFTLFDLNGVRITRAIGRVTDTGRISRLSTTLDTMLDLAKRNPAVAKVMTIGKRLGDATLGKLLNRLADMKQSVRQKFLENLGDLTEEQIKNILNRVTKCAT